MSTDESTAVHLVDAPDAQASGPTTPGLRRTAVRLTSTRSGPGPAPSDNERMGAMATSVQGCIEPARSPGRVLVPYAKDS